MTVMKARSIFATSFLVSALCGCAAVDFLANAEGSCIKFPTPEARADCEQRQRQTQSEFKKLQAQDQKAQRASEKDVPAKPNGLCFRHQPSGQWVCPN